MKHICLTHHIEQVAIGNSPAQDKVVGRDNGWSFVISFGNFGGFYFSRGYMKRLCLGWIAFTFIPSDIDLLIDKI